MRRISWRGRMLMASAAAIFSGGVALADHFSATWSDGAQGSWTDGSNWSTAPVFPNNSGSNTFDAQIDSFGADVDLNSTITVDGFGMIFGSLGGGGQLTVNGVGSWLGGTIAGSGTINFKSSLIIDGSDHTFANYTINIGPLATATWGDHRIVGLVGVEGGTFNNAGTFDDQTDSDWSWGVDRAPVFNNNGLYLKSAGSDGYGKSFWAVMNNTGQVHVQSSGLWLASGGTSSGSFNVDSGALLQISDFNQNFSSAGAPTTVFTSTANVHSLGTVAFSNSFGSSVTEFNGTYDSAHTLIDLHDPADFTDSGIVTFTSSAVVNSNFDGALQISSGTARFQTSQSFISFTDGTLTGGTLSSTNDLFFNTMTWSGGIISGDEINSISTGALTFTGTDFKQLRSVNFYNGIGSHATISEGSLSIQDAAMVNLAGATFDFQGDASLVNDDPINTFSSFVNDGTLVKSGGTGLSALTDVTLYNNGTVLVQSGSLRLGGGGLHRGAMIVSSGATLELAQGSSAIQHEFQAGALVSGQPNSELHISGFTIFDAGSRADLDHLTLENELDLSGTMNTANMAIQNGGFANLSGATFNTSGDLKVAANGSGRMDILLGSKAGGGRGLIAPAVGSDGSVTVSGGSSWMLSSGLFIGGDATSVGGTGSLTIDSGGNVSAGTQTKVWGNGRIDLLDGSFSAGNLQILGAGKVILEPGNNKVLQAASISTDSTHGAKLDLADNKAIVHYIGPTPIDSIRQQIQSGYNGGAWLGSGITSSSAAADPGKALGYGESSVLGISSFGGVALTGNNVLIKYTWSGDANLDGRIDVRDLFLIAQHWNTSGDVWTGGDFNYDGSVNLADLKLLALHWGNGINSPLAAPALSTLLSGLGLPPVQTPEPAMMGAVLMCAVSMLRRAGVAGKGSAVLYLR